MIPLPGDASNRRYCRLSYKTDSTTHSLMLMVLSDPEQFKSPEEIGSESSCHLSELPFINLQKHLSRCYIAVPKLFFYDEKRGWLLLEDLGNLTLFDQIAPYLHNPKFLLKMYKKAIDTLITIQLEATPVHREPSFAHIRQFDESLFLWEFDHFIEYGIERRLKITLQEDKKKQLRTVFSEIASQLAALPRLFCHRDYHSRNLMITTSDSGAETIRVIDFQDALMGPPHYDLASLLRDSYVDLPEELISRLLEYYLTMWEKRSGKKFDEIPFVASFDLISLQRNLKAAGRFIYIDQVKNKDHLLPFVLPTLEKAKQTLLKYPSLKPLLQLLEDLGALQAR